MVRVTNDLEAYVRLIVYGGALWESAKEYHNNRSFSYWLGLEEIPHGPLWPDWGPKG